MMTQSQRSMDILISVVIPVLNEEKVIGQCLESLTRQTLPPASFEVIVVDNGSTDRTLAVARQFENRLTLTILRKPGVHIAALRNFAAASAKGAFLAFLDADCLVPALWLSRALVLLQSNPDMVTGAHYSIPEDYSWVARTWYQDMHRLKRGPVSYIPSGNLLLSRNLFVKMEGFDTSIETNEDSEFCHRASAAGIQVVAEPSLTVVHLGTPQTIRAFFQKHCWHGSAVRKVFWRDGVNSGNLKAVIFGLYTMVFLLATMGSLFPALLTGYYALPFVLFLLLLAGPFVMSLRAAIVRRRLGILFPLTLLFFLYGSARGLCLLGFRFARPAGLSTRKIFVRPLAENTFERAE